jgi:hypothetical protein
VSLEHINSFDTGSPGKLSRQLSDLEDNVAAELERVRGSSVPVPAISSFLASAARGITNLQADQQLSVDTSQAPAAVVFPPLNPNNFGRRFVIIKRTAANNIVTSCQDASVLCNGAAFPALAAVGRYEFSCDASGYYR